jgi:NADH dehydrogenase [ubiquinone] 1 alpha subcomplex assembly factor 5
MMGLGGGIGGVLKLVQIDSSSLQLHRDNNDKNNNNNNNNNNHSYENSNGNSNTESKSTERCGTYKLVADEEGPLPFPNGTFDLVLSSTSLHWVNNLPGLFQEVKRVLKPDGCFIFAMVGGTTLFELRSSLVLAEMERDGGVSTHVGPFVDVSDVGSLLSNAGFNLTTIDVDTIQFSFPNSMVLMEHLQRMGEGNACMNRRNTVSPSTFLASACIYDEMFRLNEQNGDSQNTEQEIEASVQVIYAIGWTPHESQPKPKERGSATHKLGEVTIH